MRPYLLVPLVSCVVSAMLAVAILARDRRHRANRLASALCIGIGFWAFCEVMWNAAASADAALAWVRVSSLGWFAIGPLGLALFLEITADPAPRLRRALGPAWAAAAGFCGLALLTPWMHAGMERVPWGFAYRFGPAYPLFYVLTIACLSAAVLVGVRGLGRRLSPAEARQMRWVLGGTLVPLAVASATDGLLPLAGVQVPHLGTASFTVLAGTMAWSFHRWGYSLLAPGDFAREILETLPEGVALLRLDGTIRLANGALVRLTGVRADRLPGRRMQGFLPDAALDAPEAVQERECRLRPERGDPIPVSLSTLLLRDKRSLPLGVVAVVRDLREVVGLRERLVTSGRMAAVGELAAGIAHEINNPLAFVRSNLGALRRHWGALEGKLPADAGPEAREAAEEAPELLEECLEGVDRVAAIVRDVKGFSHAGRGEREPVDVNALLERVLRMTGPELRHRVRVERDFGRVPDVRAHPQQLSQVFLNLLLNASHAVGDRGTLRLRTRRAEAGVCVEVEDDGCGIPRAVRERVFDPFFTTKDVGEGTGLGLAIAYQIVRSHAGELSLRSEPGRGTEVRVWLPLGAEAEG